MKTASSNSIPHVKSMLRQPACPHRRLALLIYYLGTTILLEYNYNAEHLFLSSPSWPLEPTRCMGVRHLALFLVCHLTFHPTVIHNRANIRAGRPRTEHAARRRVHPNRGRKLLCQRYLYSALRWSRSRPSLWLALRSLARPHPF